MTGKSQAALIYTKALCDIHPTIRVGVSCKSIYKRLVAQGVPEINLVKCWEKLEELPVLWYEESP